MAPFNTPSIERLFAAILSLRDQEDCAKFFEDICTIKELQAMVQRFQVACQLEAGWNYNQVSSETGASSATISRVSKCLNYGSGGYREALDRMKEEGTL